MTENEIEESWLIVLCVFTWSLVQGLLETVYEVILVHLLRDNRLEG